MFEVGQIVLLLMPGMAGKLDDAHKRFTDDVMMLTMRYVIQIKGLS